MNKNNGIRSYICAGLLVAVLSAGCGAEVKEHGFDADAAIGTVSREDGSGTRGSFGEIFGLVRKENGKKIDYTSPETAVSSSTAVMLSTVAGDIYAIGYASLGAVGNTVRILPIDGVAATAENIRSGAYQVTHPFNLLTKGQLSPAANDLLGFIRSAEGQKLSETCGYVASDAHAKPFLCKNPKGKVVVSGSSSVTPLMEKFKEAYTKLNPDVTIEIQQSDSSTGIADARDGTCDIGMASRNLKDSELKYGLTVSVAALDGIAVIVNPQNPQLGLTKDQVRRIYEGNVKTWREVSVR